MDPEHDQRFDLTDAQRKSANARKRSKPAYIKLKIGGQPQRVPWAGGRKVRVMATGSPDIVLVEFIEICPPKA